MTLEQILSKLPIKYTKDRKLVYKTLDEMIKNKSEVVDKFNRPGYLIYRGNYYIYQPIEINNEELSIYQRSVPPPVKVNKIDISNYVIKMEEENNQLQIKEQYNISDVMAYIIEYFENIKNKSSNNLFESSFTLTDQEIYQIIIDYLIVSYKHILLNHLLIKEINKEKLDATESIILKCLDKNIIHKGYLEMSKDKTIVGFRLVEDNEQTFYKYNSSKKIFESNINFKNQILDIQKILYNKSNKFVSNKVYGYVKYDKPDQPAQFKIRDLSKGDKKAIKGITCIYKSRIEILQHLRDLSDKSKEISTRTVMCNDIEMILRRNDKEGKDSKRWFFTVEETKELEDLEKHAF